MIRFCRTTTDSTIVFPVTAAKPEKENHFDGTIEAVMLSCPSGQPTAMFRDWKTATDEV